MSTTVKAILVLLISLSFGAVGFYLGFRAGAHTLGTLYTQNRVSELIGRIETSAATLDSKDLASLQRTRTHEVRSALFDLGAAQDDIAYWSCSARDRDSIMKGAKYLAAHADPPLAPELAQVMNPQIQKGLRFCQDRDHYESGESYLRLW